MYQNECLSLKKGTKNDALEIRNWGKINLYVLRKFLHRFLSKTCDRNIYK